MFDGLTINDLEFLRDTCSIMCFLCSERINEHKNDFRCGASNYYCNMSNRYGSLYNRLSSIILKYYDDCI